MVYIYLNIFLKKSVMTTTNFIKNISQPVQILAEVHSINLIYNFN